MPAKKAAKNGAASAAPITALTYGGRKQVADAVLRVRPAESPEKLNEWLAVLDEYRSAFARGLPGYPSQDHLSAAREMYQRARRADDVATATWAGMRFLDHMWRALMADAAPLITAGVKQYRKSEAANLKKSAKAETQYEKWQKAADEIWENCPTLTAIAVAEALEKAGHGSSNTIRRKIKRPK